MLQKLIGLHRVEQLELRLDSSRFTILKANLSTFKETRDAVAHTHMKGITLRLDAPDVTKLRLYEVYEGLRDIDRSLRSMKL